MSRAFFSFVWLWGWFFFCLFFFVLFEVPWCASWPFSASSVWCVSCCLDLKAPASSAAPSTAVVWHVCKHTNTRVSQQTSTSRKVRRHLHKQIVPEGQKQILFLLHSPVSCSPLMMENWVLHDLDWCFRWSGFTCDSEDWVWEATCWAGWRKSELLLVKHVQKLCRGSVLNPCERFPTLPFFPFQLQIELLFIVSQVPKDK